MINLPPGTSESDIERRFGPPAEWPCELCGDPCETDEEIRIGLCARHLEAWHAKREEEKQ